MSNELWSVEWSESQQCFHVDYLTKVLTKNREIFIDPNYCNDWSILFIAKSYSEAHKFVEKLKSIRSVGSLEDKIPESKE